MPRAICIHGAWQGSWSWKKLVSTLEGSDVLIDALDLPGNGTDDTLPEAVTLDVYVGHVLRRVALDDSKVWLIAHSGAGIIASQVAETVPHRIAGILYIAGMMLPSGQTYAGLVTTCSAVEPAAGGVGPYLQWSPDRLTSCVPPEAARRFFFQDADPGDAAWATARLTPQPEGGRAVRASLTSGRFGQVRRVYLETLHDRSVLPGMQRRMQAAMPGALAVALPTGHCPQLVAPRAVADIVQSLVR